MLRALLHRLGLQTEFYLTRAFPLPSTLVVAAAACLLPSASAYNLLAMTASPSSDPTGDSNDRDHPGSGAQQIESSGVSGCTSIMPKALPCSSRTPLGMVLGMIEVQPAPVASAAAPARGPNVRSGLQLSALWQCTCRHCWRSNSSLGARWASCKAAVIQRTRSWLRLHLPDHQGAWLS